MKTCFFISQIGEPESSQRKHSDKVLKHIVLPALSGFEYDIRRADHITKPGTITMQVFRGLLDSDLVIADLSGGNPNVFYELAVRHMTKKPFVQLLLEGEPPPFDVAPERTIRFSFDIENIELAKKSLRQMTEAAVSDPDGCRTILSMTCELGAMGNETATNQEFLTTPEKAILAEILSRVQEIQSALTAGAQPSVPLSSLFYGGVESTGLSGFLKEVAVLAGKPSEK